VNNVFLSLSPVGLEQTLLSLHEVIARAILTVA